MNPAPSTANVSVGPAGSALEAQDRRAPTRRRIAGSCRLNRFRPEQHAGELVGDALGEAAPRVLARICFHRVAPPVVAAFSVEGRTAPVDADKASGGRRPNDRRKGRRRSNNRRGRGRARHWHGPATCRARRGRGRRLRMRVAERPRVPGLLVENGALERLGLVARARHPQANVAAAVVAGEE